jgi:hypothetical protein
MRAVEDEFLAVDEAAALWRVASSTMRRGIRIGGVPAYRIGPHRFALCPAQIVAMITPMRPVTVTESQLAFEPEFGSEQGQDEANRVLEQIRQQGANLRAALSARRRSPEEKLAALAAFERSSSLRKWIVEDHDGPFFPPSWVLLGNVRDVRGRQLSQERSASTPQLRQSGCSTCKRAISLRGWMWLRSKMAT